MGSDIITKYFPAITSKQLARFEALAPLYAEWNEKINVISRKDIDNLYERHILHSLAIAQVVEFLPGKHILDVGTGGGFPGIPLAIMFPDTMFHLVDSIGKKLTVVQAVADALKLDNVTVEHVRAEAVGEHFDFVVTRAVADLSLIYQWVNGKFKQHSKHPINNGILALKGGDLSTELKPFGKKARQFPISNMFTEEFFKEKYVVYLPVTNR